MSGSRARPSNSARRGRIPAPNLTLCTVVLCASAHAHAGLSPQLEFKRLENAEPPHNSIYSIVQDRDGFLWIGTHDGLGRFDGYEMKVFRHDPRDVRSLSNNSVHVLLEDRRGSIWIGTENGLNRLDTHRLEFERIAIPGYAAGAEPWFNCAFEDDAGVIWFGTEDSLMRYEPLSRELRVYRHRQHDPSTLARRSVIGVQQDSDGNLWAAACALGDCVLNRLKPDHAGFDRYPVVPVRRGSRSFFIDRDDRFWLHPSGPLTLDSGGAFFTPSLPFTGCNTARAALQSEDGAVWIGCNDGLYRWDPAAGNLSRRQVVEDQAAWLENFIRAAIIDRAGTFWVGTEGGLYSLDPNAKPFFHLSGEPDNPNSLSANAVSAIVEDAEGRLWIGTFGGGLNMVDLRTGKVERVCAGRSDPLRCTSEVIWDLELDEEGVLWIAGSHLWSLDPETRRLEMRCAAVDPEDFFFIASQGRNTLWLTGLEGRLHRFSKRTGALETLQVNDELQTTWDAIRFDSLLVEGDRLWIGNGEALGTMDLATLTVEWIPLEAADGTSLRSQGTWDVHRDRAGSLWLGTSVGLLHFEPTTRRFTAFTTPDGLPGSAVYSVLEDEAGRLWLGTNPGLSRFDANRSEAPRFRSYTAKDGLGSTEFNRHAAVLAADGTMIFGGMNGLTSFHPDRVLDNPYIPPIEITRIEVSSRDGVREVMPGGLDQLELSPDDKTFGFEFAALSFTAPETNRYAYRLDGFDSGWVEAGTRRSCQYTNIPPGQYTFRVKGSNNDGAWNEEGTALPVLVRPAVWQTWWFRSLVIVTLATLAATAYWYRTAKRRELERVRLRIAGDLHDDVSSDLSGVAMVADMMQRKSYLEERDRDDLAEVRESALKMVDAVRDIVWYIDPEHDSLDSTVARMKGFAATMLRGADVQFVVDLPSRSIALQMATRRALFLVFKEALHNVVRHALANRVLIELEVSGGSIRLAVSDDGVGFDSEHVGDGHGLRSMRRRASEIGGTCDIRSRPEQGTTVELSFNLARSRDGESGGQDRSLIRSGERPR